MKHINKGSKTYAILTFCILAFCILSLISCSSKTAPSGSLNSEGSDSKTEVSQTFAEPVLAPYTPQYSEKRKKRLFKSIKKGSKEEITALPSGNK